MMTRGEHTPDSGGGVSHIDRRKKFRWTGKSVAAFGIAVSLVTALATRELNFILQNQKQDIRLDQQGEQIKENTKTIREKLVTKDEFANFVKQNEADHARISFEHGEIMDELAARPRVIHYIRPLPQPKVH